MATYTVLGSTAPVLTDLNDSDSYALGMVVEISGAGQITHARRYGSTTAPSGPIAWRVSDLTTGDLLGSHIFSSAAPGWIEEALAVPIEIPAPQNVVVWIGTPDRYVATTNFFTSGAGSAGITNGPLTAPASGDDPGGVGNGRFGGDPDSVPAGTISGGNYFVDLVFADAPLPPSEGTADIGLGLAVAATGDAPAVDPNEGTVTIGLGLAVAATGDAPAIDPNEGSADFPISYAFSGTGETPPVGTAEGSVAIGLGLGLAAVGGRTSAAAAGIGLGLAVAATGDAPAVDPGEGAVTLGLGLALAATGAAPATDPGEGEADFPIAYAFSGTGFTPVPGEASGVAAFSLNLALSGSGANPSAEGVAAFSINLALAVAGDNGTPFRCRPVRSFAEVLP